MGCVVSCLKSAPTQQECATIRTISENTAGGEPSAPIRSKDSYAQWFSDGKSFMHHAADLLEMARKEIFISGWFLSPELHMKRPMVEGKRWRLDLILKRKAEQGVKIYIMVWKEVHFLSNESERVKEKLEALNPNIKIMVLVKIQPNAELS